MQTGYDMKEGNSVNFVGWDNGILVILENTPSVRDICDMFMDHKI